MIRRFESQKESKHIILPANGLVGVRHVHLFFLVGVEDGVYGNCSKPLLKFCGSYTRLDEIALTWAAAGSFV